MRRVAEAARDEQELLVRARCAPHFKRVALEMDPPLPVTLIQGYEAGGCLAGTRYCRVTPEGELTACPFMESSVGSLRDSSFLELWTTAPQFAELRAPRLKGRCGVCEYSVVCGGCRARPLARDGDLMGEDFLCGYQPSGGAVVTPLPDRGPSVAWSRDAEARLARVPSFVRRFVRQRAESYAREIGASMVLPGHLETLARRRFGDKAPPFMAGRPGHDD